MIFIRMHKKSRIDEENSLRKWSSIDVPLGGIFKWSMVMGRPKLPDPFTVGLED